LIAATVEGIAFELKGELGATEGQDRIENAKSKIAKDILRFIVVNV